MKKIVVLSLLLLVGSLCRAQVPAGSWSGAIKVQGVSLTLVFNLSEEACTLDVPDQGAKGIPAQASLTALGALHIDIAALNASFEGFRLGEKIVGTFTQHGDSFPLTLSPGVTERKRPQTPQPPFPYSMEEVSFVNGDAVLKGTLVLPEGCDRSTPVLLMVTGSGLQNRDEEIYEHKPFAVIADALAKAGITTLRYDDRGFGESTGDIINCTTEDFKNDALAGIELLKGRFDKVGVLGHSEGGAIAFQLAAEKKADFVVSLAGMVVSGAQTLLWQNKVALLAAGIPEATVNTYCKLLGEAFEARMAGKTAPSAQNTDLPDALKQNYSAAVMQLMTPYMKYFLALDVRPLLPGITCPVLALNGTKDTQVECSTNLDALRNGLPAGAQLVPVEGVNHLFQHCTTGASTEYRDIEETFAPEALSALVQWVSALK